MRILIGTKNPGKIQGAKEAVKKYFDDFDIEGVSVESEVGEQPVNDEIYLGARNRVNNAIIYANENNIDVDYFLGIESGITNLLGKWMIVQIAVIKDKNGYEGFGTGPAFPIPEKYVNKIIENTFGKFMDNMFNKHDLGKSNGGISFFTHNEITRIDQTREAFIMALTPFINGEIWRD